MAKYTDHYFVKETGVTNLSRSLTEQSATSSVFNILSLNRTNVSDVGQHKREESIYADVWPKKYLPLLDFYSLHVYTDLNIQTQHSMIYFRFTPVYMFH